MGFFRDKPLAATVNGEEFSCLVCRGELFLTRDIKLNTTGMEFLDLGWANRSSLGVICIACGYVHEFLGNGIEFWEPVSEEEEAADAQ